MCPRGTIGFASESDAAVSWESGFGISLSPTGPKLHRSRRLHGAAFGGGGKRQSSSFMRKWTWSPLEEVDFEPSVFQGCVLTAPC